MYFGSIAYSNNLQLTGQSVGEGKQRSQILKMVCCGTRYSCPKKCRSVKIQSQVPNARHGRGKNDDNVTLFSQYEPLLHYELLLHYERHQ